MGGVCQTKNSNKETRAPRRQKKLTEERNIVGASLGEVGCSRIWWLPRSPLRPFETDRSRPKEFIALSPQPGGGDGFHRLWRVQHLLKQANSMKT